MARRCASAFVAALSGIYNAEDCFVIGFHFDIEREVTRVRVCDIGL